LNVFEVRCTDGLNLRFVDLPGYGWARRSKDERSQWQTMIEGYLTQRTGLRAVVLLVDVRRGIEDEERQLIDFLRQPRTVAGPKPEVILVATKIDKLGLAARKPALEKVRLGARPFPVLGFSATTGEGREDLWRKIRAATLGVVGGP
jgi:GTP-binding protein